MRKSIRKHDFHFYCHTSLLPLHTSLQFFINVLLPEGFSYWFPRTSLSSFSEPFFQSVPLFLSLSQEISSEHKLSSMTQGKVHCSLKTHRSQYQPESDRAVGINGASVSSGQNNISLVSGREDEMRGQIQNP